MAQNRPPSRPFIEPDRVDVSGAAARSRIRGYRDNADEPRDRSLAGLLQWAATLGVQVPDYARVILIEENGDYRLTCNGVRVDAKYFEAQGVPENQLIYWNKARDPYRSVFVDKFDAVVISMAQQVMRNDERFLHVLAHEVFEVTALKAIFDECGGSMPASRFYDLTEPLSTVRNLHWYAWERADALIERLREIAG